MADLIPESDLAWSIVDPQAGRPLRVAHEYRDMRCEHVPSGITAIVPINGYYINRARAVSRQMIECALTSPEYRT